MLLITGLGNPGESYTQTRHNIGFLFVDYLADAYHFSPWKLEKKWQGFIAKGTINGEKIVLLKPQTFMNASGQAVQPLAHYYQIPSAEVMVVVDDLDQDFGFMKWKTHGGSGGHNGLKSITQQLGTDQYPRLKFGINNELKSRISPSDFVLKKFTKDELSELPKIFSQGEKIMLENIRHIN